MPIIQQSCVVKIMDFSKNMKMMHADKVAYIAYFQTNIIGISDAGLYSLSGRVVLPPDLATFWSYEIRD